MHNIDYVRLFFDWVPFLAIFGLLFYFMKKGIGGKQAGYMDFMKDYYTKHLEYCSSHLEETRKNNAILARIALAMEQAIAEPKNPKV